MENIKRKENKGRYDVGIRGKCLDILKKTKNLNYSQLSKKFTKEIKSNNNFIGLTYKGLEKYKINDIGLIVLYDFKSNRVVHIKELN